MSDLDLENENENEHHHDDDESGIKPPKAAPPVVDTDEAKLQKAGCKVDQVAINTVRNAEKYIQLRAKCGCKLCEADVEHREEMMPGITKRALTNLHG